MVIYGLTPNIKMHTQSITIHHNNTPTKGTLYFCIVSMYLLYSVKTKNNKIAVGM